MLVRRLTEPRERVEEPTLRVDEELSKSQRWGRGIRLVALPLHKL